jgi:hypothetical protein
VVLERGAAEVVVVQSAPSLLCSLWQVLVQPRCFVAKIPRGNQRGIE